MNWFKQKWNFDEIIPIDDVYNRLSDLEINVKTLEERIEELERENVETTNSMYEIANSLESRIDILMEKLLWKTASESQPPKTED